MPQGTPSTGNGRVRYTLSPSGYRTVATISLVTIVVIIVVGAAVRLTGSGLGCADWPNCGDQVLEFGSTNQTIEQANRLLSGFGGIAAAAVAVIGARRRRPYRRDLTMWSLGLVAGVLGNIPLGGITVLVNLHPAAVASHFVLGMILLSTATVLLWRASHEIPTQRTCRVRQLELNLSRVMVVSAAALMITGPLVTGSGPHAGDATARRFGFMISTVTRIHSFNMWIFLILATVLLSRLGATRVGSDILRRGTVMLVAIIVQGAIGYTQYELGIPGWLVILHIAGSAAVVGSTIWFHLGLFAPSNIDVPSRSEVELAGSVAR